MKWRSVLWTLVLGALVFMGFAKMVGLGEERKVQGTPHSVATAAESLTPAVKTPTPTPSNPQELKVANREQPAVITKHLSEVVGRVEGRLAAVVKRLEDLEARRPLDYHHGAVAELRPLLSMEQTEQERALDVEEALEILDEWTLSSRVRGSMLALVGGWGQQAEVLARCFSQKEGQGEGQGEAWRSAMIGLMCTDSSAGEPSGLTLELSEFLDKVPRTDVALLPFDLGRVPDETLHALLFDTGSRLASDLDGWHSRNLAILALGTSVDQRPATLDLMTRLLFDNSPWGEQVRLPVCFVLTQARSDEAREVVLAFLEDTQTGEGGKSWVRWWLGERPVLPRELQVLAAPLQEASASEREKFAAVGSLLRRGAMTTPQEAALIETWLVDALDQESDDFLRSALIMTLAESAGGAERFRALEQVLRTAPKAGHRRWAAKGLGKVHERFSSQARAALLAVEPGEKDPQVLAALQEALMSLP